MNTNVTRRAALGAVAATIAAPTVAALADDTNTAEIAALIKQHMDTAEAFNVAVGKAWEAQEAAKADTFEPVLIPVMPVHDDYAKFTGTNAGAIRERIEKRHEALRQSHSRLARKDAPEAVEAISLVVERSEHECLLALETALTAFMERPAFAAWMGAEDEAKSAEHESRMAWLVLLGYYPPNEAAAKAKAEYLMRCPELWEGEIGQEELAALVIGMAPPSVFLKDAEA